VEQKGPQRPAKARPARGHRDSPNGWKRPNSGIGRSGASRARRGHRSRTTLKRTWWLATGTLTGIGARCECDTHQDGERQYRLLHANTCGTYRSLSILPRNRLALRQRLLSGASSSSTAFTAALAFEWAP